MSSTNTAAPSDLLTIVIPTRDRVDLLDRCLHSVFERQSLIPAVIVSDNSTSDSPQMEVLRSKYDFSYVRQSGQLTMTAHHNACLDLPRTPWALLLHDDDELCPNAVDKLPTVLADCHGEGIVVAGIEFIDIHGVTTGRWIPESDGTLKGEAGVLQLGLDFRASPPGCVWNVAAFRQVGGFPDASGAAADYTLALRLAFSHGVRLLPELIGRYRVGSQQATTYSTPESAEKILDISIRMAQLTRTIGVSAATADRLVDYMTWWIFRIIAGELQSTHPYFVSRLARRCETETPPDGVWRARIRNEFPVFFMRPQWIAIPLFRARVMLPAPLRRWFGARAAGFVTHLTRGSSHS